MSQNIQKPRNNTSRANSSYSTRKKLELLDSLSYQETAKSFHKSQGAFSKKNYNKDDLFLRNSTDNSIESNRRSLSNLINLKQSIDRNIMGINAIKSNLRLGSPTQYSEYNKDKIVATNSDRSSNISPTGLLQMAYNKQLSKDSKRKMDFELDTDLTHLLKKNGLSNKLRGNLTSKSTNAFNKGSIAENLLSKLHKENTMSASLLKQQNKQNSNVQNKKMVNYELTKSNEKSKGIVEGFGICTTQGISRNYNEDRVSVILNVTKVGNEQSEDHKSVILPNCSYFSVFDGHGGNKCANFLRENLHQYIQNDPAFPKNIVQALKNGIYKAENEWLSIAKSKNEIDKSGSCVTLVLFVNQTSYFVNVGDSRGIMSIKRGHIKKSVTEDHKPSTDLESKRIYNAGGKIYRTRLPVFNFSMLEKADSEEMESKLFGPFRVVPGKLSVSRTIGDIYAKEPILGGNPNVVVCEPDIFPKLIEKNDDFIILCSDGIFDLISTADVISLSWSVINKSLNKGTSSIHQLSKDCVEAIVVEAMKKKSSDNLTAIFIALPGLVDYCNEYWYPKENVNKSNLQGNSSNISKILENSNTDRSKTTSLINKSDSLQYSKLYPNHSRKVTPSLMGKKDQYSIQTDRKDKQQDMQPTSTRNKPNIVDLLAKFDIKFDPKKFTRRNYNSFNGSLLNGTSTNTERPMQKALKGQSGERKLLKNNYF